MAENPITQKGDGDENNHEMPVQQQLETEPNSETNLVKNTTQNSIHKEGIGKETKKKVDVLLKAAGDAPIMKKKKWAVDGSKTVAYLIEFIKKYIKCESAESLFIYVNQAFAPAPDQVINNLYECYGADGRLVLYYCKSQAWG